ncbi:RDD family protein [Tautonia sociabilis]|uniref:RDD family protein n=1 Tax=Tautonia sociabilis TaxID=2080755 RepID=A0A432MG10_9BACT|nr:RDD family protein [Tautonia sociabilis]RUL85416.1 RDD family protein [Tautonia sociabilis]
MASSVLDPTSGAGAPDEPLDTTVRLITPERITFLYPLAGPFRRATAYLIDLLVLVMVGFLGLLLSLALSLGTAAGGGLFLVVVFVLRFGYGALLEGLFNGQTIGKRAMGIRVVSVEGVPITGGQAFLRNLLWCLDGMMPFAYMPALASMILTRRFQRLGDLAARTMVIVEQRPPRAGVANLEEKAVAAILPRLPTRIDAGPELARALSDYVTHRKRFSPSRREEMAGHLARPARQKYGLPDDVPGDALLCALYHRVFLEG